MQWADCLLVSIVSEATGFYLLEVYLESSHKCQQRNLQSLFSVKLCDNSKIVIVLYYHNRSTIQSDKLYNRATQLKLFSQTQVLIAH